MGKLLGASCGLNKQRIQPVSSINLPLTTTGRQTVRPTLSNIIKGLQPHHDNLALCSVTMETTAVMQQCAELACSRLALQHQFLSLVRCRFFLFFFFPFSHVQMSRNTNVHAASSLSTFNMSGSLAHLCSLSVMTQKRDRDEWTSKVPRRRESERASERVSNRMNE